MAPTAFSRLDTTSKSLRATGTPSLVSPPMFSIVGEILVYLHPQDLFSTMQVCRALYHPARDQLYRNVKVRMNKRIESFCDKKQLYKTNSRWVEAWKIMSLLDRLRYWLPRESTILIVGLFPPRLTLQLFYKG